MTRLQKRTEAACGRSEKPTTRNYTFAVTGHVTVEGFDEADARANLQAGIGLVGDDDTTLICVEVE